MAKSVLEKGAASKGVDLKGHSFLGLGAASSPLRNADVRIGTGGEMAIIVGRFGCGKTLLINSIIGEGCLISPNEGEGEGINAPQTLDQCCYAPQSPWILNTTLRNNITLNLRAEASKDGTSTSSLNAPVYDSVIHACDLREDIASFDYGDMTVIGERGVTLERGPKAEACAG